MIEKILLWIDYGFLNYGVSKYLKKEFELYAIIDGINSTDNFFKNQKLIHFNKIWYFDSSIKSKNVDLIYLKEIEKSYKINIWEIIYSDRYFYSKFNKYHTFDHDEILSLIENECKFFNEILIKLKPKYVIMNTITHHYQQLFYKICLALGITVLTLEPTRFGNNWIVLKGSIYDWKPEDNSITSDTKSFKSFNEIQNFMKSNPPAKFYLEKPELIYDQLKWKKLKAFFSFFFLQSIDNKRYSRIGRTKFNIIFKGTAIAHKIIRKKRELFLEKNLIKKIDTDIPFLYYSLHLEPERVLLLGAKYLTNQISVIENIAKSLPVGYKLVVKEHPFQYQQGWRPIQFYKDILNLPNVILVHPLIKSDELIKKSSLVISIRGTTSLEATIFGKPSIVLQADIGHTLIPTIQVLKNWEELPQLIKKSLEIKCDPSNISSYFSFIQKNSFNFPNELYSSELSNYFHYNVGFSKQYEINDEKMLKFLEQFDDLFHQLFKELIKKMC